MAEVRSLSLLEKNRLCLACRTLKETNDFFKCSRCHAAAYCNRTCQKKHWKEHKLSCKSQSGIPPTQEDAMCMIDNFLPSATGDSDKLYKYILITPTEKDKMKNFRLPEDFYSHLIGIESDVDVDEYRKFGVDEVIQSQTENVCKKYEEVLKNVSEYSRPRRIS